MNLWCNKSGQALIEWAILLPLYISLFIALFCFGEWVLIRQQLHQSAKLGAFLYSSGRMEKPFVKQIVQRTLQRGSPSLNIPLSAIEIGLSNDPQAKQFKLDKVTVRYLPPSRLKRYFTGLMEESCTIKHAPSYFGLYGNGLGPPVKG